MEEKEEEGEEEDNGVIKKPLEGKGKRIQESFQNRPARQTEDSVEDFETLEERMK